MEIVILYVRGYGYLPLVKQDGVELYRGEYQQSVIAAATKAEEWRAQHE
jgi:hypothetical protein